MQTTHARPRAPRARPPALKSGSSTSSSPQTSEPTTPSIAPYSFPANDGKDTIVPVSFADAMPVARPRARSSASDLSASFAATGGPVLSQQTLGGRSREELELLLLRADELIVRKEKELAVAATLGQSLLQHNNVLRGKHDALAARLGVEQSTSPSRSLRFSPSIANFVNSKGSTHNETTSLTENAPKQAPARPPLREMADPSNPSVETAPSSSSYTQLPRRRTRTRTCSSASALPSVPASPRSSDAESRQPSPSRTSPPKLARLDMRNAELAAQLEDLQAETARADRVGKQKLRKLDRELAGLREELAAALANNSELEQKLAVSSTQAREARSVDIAHELGASDHAWTAPRAGTPTLRQITPRIAVVGEYFSDTDLVRAQLAQRQETDDPGDGPLPVVEAELSQDVAPESLIVTQLMDKIHELETTNEAITAHREELDERLQRAQVELDGLRKSYEELEVDIRREEAERFQQRPLEIQWHNQQGSVTTASPSKRRAGGNRKLIGRRKLSMTLSRQPSIAALRHASSRASLRLTAGSPRRHLRHKVSSASMFFGDDTEAAAADHEDLIDALQREDMERRGRFAAEFSPASQRGTPASKAAYPSLGSELGSLWGSPTAPRHDITHRPPLVQDASDDEEYDDPQPPPLHVPRFASVPDRSPARPDHDAHLAGTSHSDCQDPFTTKDDLIPLGGLRDSQRPDEDAYDLLDRAASETIVAWEDNASKARLGWSNGPTFQGGFAYEDNSDGEGAANDPWGEQGLPQIETADMLRERQRAEQREVLRQNRLRRVAESETASIATTEHAVPPESTAARRRRALRRLARSSSADHAVEGTEPCDPAEDYECLGTTRPLRRRHDADYWPLTLRARYAPSMVANRVRTELHAYIDFVTSWIRVFAVITLAVIYAISNGPSLVLGSSQQRRLARHHPS